MYLGRYVFVNPRQLKNLVAYIYLYYYIYLYFEPITENNENLESYV